MNTDPRLNKRSMAIRKVLAAGRRDELLKLIRAAANTATSRYKEIIGDDGRTAEWKRSELRIVRDASKGRLDTEIERLAATVERDMRSDGGLVWGIDGLPGDPASLRISRRDADDRVSTESKPEALIELLSRAKTSGDEVLVRAVLARAIDIGNETVVNEVIRDVDDRAGARVQRLWDFSRKRENVNTWQVAAELGALTPPQVK